MSTIMFSLALTFFKTVVYIYDVVTWPINLLLSGHHTFILDMDRRKCPTLARSIEPTDPATPWCCNDAQEGLTTTLVPGCETLDDLWNRAISLWPDKPALGTRKLIKTDTETDSSGRELKKLTLGEYHWLTFSEADRRVRDLAAGFFHLGLRANRDRISIFAETSAEWMLVAQACFRSGVPLVTMYATLGAEAIVYGLLEAETEIVVTSDELLPKLSPLLHDTPTVRTVIVLGGHQGGCQVHGSSRPLTPPHNFPSSIRLLSVGDIERMGRESGDGTNWSLATGTVTRSSLAIIMYTSGSSGRAKGVLMNHGNLMAAMSGQYNRMPTFLPNSDTYVAYLPLAHVLELCCELVSLAVGVRVGYSSPLTLTDRGSKLSSGCPGDVMLLQPTLMACVPTILDRISKAVWEKVNGKGLLARELFRFAYSYKSSNLDRAVSNVFIERLVFGGVRQILGGKVRYMLSGGAPLSEESQHFVNVCFCPILQGYGLTETSGAGSALTPGDLRGNHVGPPLTCLRVMLAPCPDSSYAPTDLPRPRGEIVIGGECVAMGYFKQPEKTAESFYVDDKGMRWFRSGDVGLMHADGTLSIIDRQKDLVKMQTGEYVSLGKVELALAPCPLVETICVHVDPLRDFPICLVSPNRNQLAKLALTLGIPGAQDHQKLCQNAQVKAAVLKELQRVAREKKLERFEIPTQIHLDPTSWTPDTGLVTDSLKLKRRVIEEKFRQVIEFMLSAT